MNLTERPPSTAWEPVALPDSPACQYWAWFKPSHDPHSILLWPTEETLDAGFTLRQLLTVADIDPAEVGFWTVQGVVIDAQGGKNPLLDEPLPEPKSENDAVIAVRLSSAPLCPVASFPSGDPLRILDAIDADWQSTLLLERQLQAIQRQLGAVQGRLQSLNRDLSPEEFSCSDNNDRNEWQDTRRWLREAQAQVSRYIREYDIGMTSVAGHRKWFEEIYHDFIKPRRVFPELPAARHSFKQHRKTAQTLLSQMQSTQAMAASDGVQRAQLVLGRIASKVRAARVNRGS